MKTQLLLTGTTRRRKAVKIKTLYRYKQNEMITDSPLPPEDGIDVVERYRLVAEDGLTLTQDGEKYYRAIDIDKDQLALWEEVEKPIETQEDIEEEE